MDTGRRPAGVSPAAPGPRPAALRLAGGLVAGAMLAAFGVLLWQVVAGGWLAGPDATAAERVHGFFQTRPALFRTLRLLTHLGVSLWLYGIVGLVAGALLLRRQAAEAAWLAAATALGGAGLNTLVKALVGRPRPDFEAFEGLAATAAGSSFPSGHAMNATVVYGGLLVLLLPLVPSRWRPWLLASAGLVVLLVGFTRVALGVHFPTDVAAGFLLGGAWLTLAAPLRRA